jgi:hypothetical protein
MSLCVYRFLIEQIIGSDETFHDEIATILAERQAITTAPRTSDDFNLETMANANDTQSYIDSFLSNGKANQVRRLILG